MSIFKNWQVIHRGRRSQLSSSKLVAVGCTSLTLLQSTSSTHAQVSFNVCSKFIVEALTEFNTLFRSSDTLERRKWCHPFGKKHQRPSKLRFRADTMQNLLVGSASATCDAAIDRHRALQSVVLGQSSPSCTTKGHPSPEPLGRCWSFVFRITSRTAIKKGQIVSCLCWLQCCHRKVYRDIIVNFLDVPWCHRATHVVDTCVGQI